MDFNLVQGGLGGPSLSVIFDLYKVSLNILATIVVYKQFSHIFLIACHVSPNTLHVYIVSCKNFEDLRLVYTGNRNISIQTCSSYAVFVDELKRYKHGHKEKQLGHFSHFLMRTT